MGPCGEALNPDFGQTKKEGCRDIAAAPKAEDEK